MKKIICLFALLCSSLCLASEPFSWEDVNLLLIEKTLDQAEEELFSVSLDVSIETFSHILVPYDTRKAPTELLCRALLGRALAFAVRGDEDEALADLDLFHLLIVHSSCSGCLNHDTATDLPVPPLEKCLGRVAEMETSLLSIVAKLPIKARLKTSIVDSISTVAFQAKDCCRQGGVWKACLQPLLEKWQKLSLWQILPLSLDLISEETSIPHKGS